MASQCETLFAAMPAALNSELIRNRTRYARTGFDLTKIWNMNNQNTTSDSCDIIDLTTGETSKLNCSEKRPFVCIGSAWTNFTNNSGDSFGFSQVKLRNQDAHSICKEKGSELMLPGGLVTISSSRIQRYLTTFTQSSKVGYWISDAHADPTKTQGYNNWVENRTNVTKGDSCVYMKPNGIWDNFYCYDRIRFICEWKKEVVPTTTAAATTQPTKAMATSKIVTTTMSPKMVTSKMVPTEAVEHTTVSMTTTSGSPIIESSIVMTFVFVAVNIFLV